MSIIVNKGPSSSVTITQPAEKVVTSTDVQRTVTAITKGPKGDKGDQGIQGIQGPKGDPGVVVQAIPPSDTTLIWVDNS